jgi:hypothetical protein
MAKRIIITKHHEESSESEAETDIFHRHAHTSNIRPFVSRMNIVIFIERDWDLCDTLYRGNYI